MSRLEASLWMLEREQLTNCVSNLQAFEQRQKIKTKRAKAADLGRQTMALSCETRHQSDTEVRLPGATVWSSYEMLTVWFGLYGKEGMQRGAEENGGPDNA
jgi:hypothetical protein